MTSPAAHEPHPNAEEWHQLITGIESIRSDRIKELSALAKRHGGQVFASELAAPCGSVCVTLAILPSGNEQPIFAFAARTDAKAFIDAAKETGHLACCGNIATTSELNFLGDAMRAARSLFCKSGI